MANLLINFVLAALFWALAIALSLVAKNSFSAATTDDKNLYPLTRHWQSYLSNLDS